MAYLEVCLEPDGALEQAHALLDGVVGHGAVQLPEGQQGGEGRLALGARRRVPVHRPRQDALPCTQPVVSGAMPALEVKKVCTGLLFRQTLLCFAEQHTAF